MAAFDLCKIPAGVSPNGVYNFVDPESLAPAVIGVGIGLGVVSTGLVAGRLFMNRKKWHSADYFTFVGWLSNIAYTGVILAQYKSYRHSWDTPVCWYTGEYLKLPFVQTMLFAPAFFFPKAAIFLLYRQLFAVWHRLRISVDIGLLLTLMLYLTEIPLAVIYAAPKPGQSWDSLLESLRINSHSFALGGTLQSAIGTILDLYIFILPLPILARMRMPTGKRLQLIGAFSTALLGVAASVVSLVYKVQILSSSDSNWLAAITSICSLIETNIALIVGCMPAFAKLVSVHVGESSFYQSLRLRLLGSKGSSGNLSPNGASHEKAPRTFGSNQTPRRKNYYELSESMLLETQVTLQGDGSEPDQPSKPSSTYIITQEAV